MQVESCQLAVKCSSHQECVHDLSRSMVSSYIFNIMTKIICFSVCVICLFPVRLTDLMCLLVHLQSMLTHQMSLTLLKVSSIEASLDVFIEHQEWVKSTLYLGCSDNNNKMFNCVTLNA